MTQISHYPLPKKLEEQMFTLFRRVLSELNSEKDVSDFLEDLLTPTEKIMLGKRLAIAFLLEKGYDQRTIHAILKVSTSTVNSVSVLLQQKGNGYRKVITMVRKEDKWHEFIIGLDKGFEELFSPKAWHRRNFGTVPKEDETEVKL